MHQRPVTSVGGKETVLVVASRKPLAELERDLEGVARADAAGPVRYATASSRSVAVLRGVGGLVDATPASTGASARRLSEIVQDLPDRAEAARDDWIRRVQLENSAR